MTTVHSPSVTVRTAAKVNLHLGVGPVRADGYHPLATAYQAIGLHSTVTATPATAWTLTCEATAPGIATGQVPLDDTNLALRAARLLADHHGVSVPGVHLHLRKGIPVAGGLAGGSADGAAALLACDRLWGCATPYADLLRLAGRLGSDVPFALVGGSAAGGGRGELVEPLADNGTWHWVVLTSAEGLSTPAVYREFDVLHAGTQVGDPVIPNALVDALRSGDPERLGAALGNDLTEPAIRLRPDLGTRLAAGTEAGALAALLSGSGPTCVFLCGDAAHADEVATALRRTHDRVCVATGPAPGATVVPTSEAG